MRNRLLRAKHWQLFLVIVGIPIALQIIFMTVIVSAIIENQMNDRLNEEPTMIMPMFFIVFVLIGLLSGGTLFGWMYSIATGLQSRVPESVNLNVKRFKLFFWTPVVYIGVIILMSITIFNGNPPHPAVLALIIPMHLFSIFCMFYTINFVAKTIKTVELQRAVTFSDFIGEFFLVWFYFVGIWILQPKVNRFQRGIINKDDVEDL